MTRTEALAIAEDLINRLNKVGPTISGPLGRVEGTSVPVRVTEILRVAEFLMFDQVGRDDG